jgi:hypothetical protein
MQVPQSTIRGVAERGTRDVPLRSRRFFALDD